MAITNKLWPISKFGAYNFRTYGKQTWLISIRVDGRVQQIFVVEKRYHKRNNIKVPNLPGLTITINIYSAFLYTLISMIYQRCELKFLPEKVTFWLRFTEYKWKINEDRNGFDGVDDVANWRDYGQRRFRNESFAHGFRHHNICQFILSSKSNHEKRSVSIWNLTF